MLIVIFSLNNKEKEMAESKLSLKLLINTQTNRVLFAEAGKDCVDFLFHILSLPVATVISLLKEQGMVGCLENLYKSVEGLDEMYILSDQKKDVLLMPVGSPAASSVSSFLLESSSPPAAKVGYTCSVHLTTTGLVKVVSLTITGHFLQPWVRKKYEFCLYCYIPIISWIAKAKDKFF